MTIPRLWPDSTVVCIASGPSVTPADVDYCRGRARVLVINDAYTLAPWADALYACDDRWWNWHKGCPDFAGLKFGMLPHAWPGVSFIRNMGDKGFCTTGQGVCTGRNSGYMAVNLAAALGAARILLLGYDMKISGRSHFFGEHPNQQKPPVKTFLEFWPNCIKPLQTMGIAVVNCSRDTALKIFPRAPIEVALP